MAAHGLRDMGDGSEAIANKAEADALRAQGRRVYAFILATALLATGLVLGAVTL